MNTPSQAQVRRAIAEAQTIVVKVGSSSLTEPSGHLDPQSVERACGGHAPACD